MNVKTPRSVEGDLNVFHSFWLRREETIMLKMSNLLFSRIIDVFTRFTRLWEEFWTSVKTQLVQFTLTVWMNEALPGTQLNNSKLMSAWMCSWSEVPDVDRLPSAVVCLLWRDERCVIVTCEPTTLCCWSAACEELKRIQSVLWKKNKSFLILMFLKFCCQTPLSRPPPPAAAPALVA